MIATYELYLEDRETERGGQIAQEWNLCKHLDWWMSEKIQKWSLSFNTLFLFTFTWAPPFHGRLLAFCRNWDHIKSPQSYIVEMKSFLKLVDKSLARVYWQVSTVSDYLHGTLEHRLSGLDHWKERRGSSVCMSGSNRELEVRAAPLVFVKLLVAV